MSLSSLRINRAVSTVYLEKEMMWMYLMLTMSHELHRLLLKTWQAAPLSWDIIWRVHTTARIQMKSEKRIQGGRINNYQQTLVYNREINVNSVIYGAWMFIIVWTSYHWQYRNLISPYNITAIYIEVYIYRCHEKSGNDLSEQTNPPYCFHEIVKPS